ncbi:hypothetical protein [Microtetraspora niveoalba]|uniref:hypothetical protein n=1 Tax=Microtetraspora niveoalba TaxID=46175 RepID=UPI00082FED3D|nr:hypothetical protein [Microtetraspora niveoalba]
MPPELHGIADGIPRPPGPEIVRSVLLASALGTPAPSLATPPVPSAGSRTRRSPWRPIVRARTLLTMEARVMHRSIWLASAFVMAAGLAFVLVRGESARIVLSLTAPLIAGVGVAGSYDLSREARDTAAELMLTTPTPPRVIMLARVTLAFGYDLALALLCSAVALRADPERAAPTFTSLVTAWIGPMAMLAALGLLLAVSWHVDGAIGVTLAVWTVYALSFTRLPVLDGTRLFWSNGTATAGLALALALAAVIAAGRREPIRFGGATHRS